jgi:plastocyanin
MLLNNGVKYSLLLAIILFSGCGDKQSEEVAEERGTTPYVQTGTEGTVKGSVSFSGTAPEPKKINMDADPACNNSGAAAEDLVIRDGRIQNVLVYVSEGKTSAGADFSSLSFPKPASAATLDQKGCVYRPHVMAVQTGQTLSITNSDQTVHNVNAQPKTNKGFNDAQSSGAPPLEKRFNRAETVIPFKCNQHAWMKAYVAVLKHPLFAVTGEDGSFEIANIPPGNYTLVTWHERLGTKSQPLTIADKESRSLDFSYDSASGNSASKDGLKIMPAIELPMLGKH